MSTLKGTAEVAAAAERIAGRVNKMLESDQTLSTLIQMLKHLDDATTQYELAIAPIAAVSKEVKRVAEERLLAEGLKNSKVAGVGAITLAVRSGFKISDRSELVDWLEKRREAGESANDLYGWFGSTLDAERVKAALAETGELPTGVSTTSVQTFRFTPARGQGEGNE